MTRYTINKQRAGGDPLAIIGGGFVIFWIALLAAWVTHIIWAILTLAVDAGATLGQIVLGVIGIFPPVGIIHGVMIWFGAGM